MSIRIPKYRLHKGSGQALVQINRDRIYLGTYGSEESKEKYERLVSEWLSNGRPRVSRPTADPHAKTDLTMNELILAYWHFAESYYSKEGEPTKELICMREALRPLRRLYGHTKPSAFGPKALKAVRQYMIDEGLSRGVVNRRIGRIKRAFKWAVAEELIPPSVLHGLQAVAGLSFGRTTARETDPVYCHVPGPQPLYQALICRKTLPDEFDRLALDLPDELNAYWGRRNLCIPGDLRELAPLRTGHEGHVEPASPINVVDAVAPIGDCDSHLGCLCPFRGCRGGNSAIEPHHWVSNLAVGDRGGTGINWRSWQRHLGASVTINSITFDSATAAVRTIGSGSERSCEGFTILLGPIDLTSPGHPFKLMAAPLG